jgi:iron complex transport system substrate-binding protein
VKIVSLLPSATEIVFALGLEDDLSAVTDECDHPDAAREKPVVSRTALPQQAPLGAGEIDRLVRASMERHESLYALDKELIQQIQPDLILTQDLCRVCAVPSGQVADALAELGCHAEVLSLDPHSLDEILDGIVAVGRATGTEDRAADLVAELRARVDRVRTAAARLLTIRAMAIEWSDPPFVAGHWIPGMLQLAGGESLLNDPGEPSQQVGWRSVANAGPEVVVFMPCGYYLEDAIEEAEGLFEIPDFADTPAARSGTVFATDATSYFSRPGPRIVDGLEILAWCLHPDAFPRPPADRVAAVG